METSSFAGGEVVNWNADVTSYFGGYGVDWINFFTTAMDVTFNFLESYLDGDTVPRQFRRMEADWHLSYWDPLLTKQNYTLGSFDYNVLSNLYASVVPLFDQMPSGLPSATPPSSSPSTSPSGTPSTAPPSPSYAPSAAPSLTTTTLSLSACLCYLLGLLI